MVMGVSVLGKAGKRNGSGCALAEIARLAGCHVVVHVARAVPGHRNDVVNMQHGIGRVRAAVLTGESVALEDFKPGFG